MSNHAEFEKGSLRQLKRDPFRFGGFDFNKTLLVRFNNSLLVMFDFNYHCEHIEPNRLTIITEVNSGVNTFM